MENDTVICDDAVKKSLWVIKDDMKNFTAMFQEKKYLHLIIVTTTGLAKNKCC